MNEVSERVSEYMKASLCALVYLRGQVREAVTSWDIANACSYSTAPHRHKSFFVHFVATPGLVQRRQCDTKKRMKQTES